MGVGKFSLSPRGHVTMSRNVFSCHHLVQGGANGIRWVEAKDIAKHSTAYRTFPTRSYLALAQFFCLFNSKTEPVCLKAFFFLTPHNLQIKTMLLSSVSQCGVFITSRMSFFQTPCLLIFCLRRRPFCCRLSYV